MHFPLTVADRMLLHLAPYYSLEDPYIFPPEMTQEGISEELGASRSYVARELKKLHECGHVRSSLARVAGAKKRMRVYCLTSTGLAEAGRLAEEMSGRAPQAPRAPGGDGDALDRLGQEIAGPRFDGNRPASRGVSARPDLFDSDSDGG